MKINRIMAFALLLSMILTLCACSETEGSYNTTALSGSSSTNAPDSSKIPNEDEKPVGYYGFETMPVIYVDCKNNVPVVSKDEYVECEVTVSGCPDEFALENVSAGIRTRGNSSLPDDPINNQAPYRIKFDKKQSMLGLNNAAKCKSWVLLLPDIGNAISFYLGQSILVEDGYYCSDAQYVELYLNGEYRGVYLLCEQSQINSERVDVYETPEGYTGYKTGYLLELNNYPEEDEMSFYTNFGDVKLKDLEGGDLSWETLNTDGKNIHARYYTVKNDNLSEEQFDFIEKYLNNLFKIAYQAIINKRYYEFNSSFGLSKSSETDAKKLIERYFDLDSIVDSYIIQEISMNTDVGAGSFFMSVDLSENAESNKLTFECPWDFNWAYNGNSRYIGEKYEGLSAATFCSDDFWKANSSLKDRSNVWYILFMRAEWFRDMVRERWKELDEIGVFDKSLEAVDFWMEAYSSEFEEHLIKWKNNWLVKAQQNRTWLENRYEWLENEFFTMDN